MPKISTDPPRVHLTLCVDTGAIGEGPIERGDGPPYLMREGQRITAQAEMRRGFRTVLGADGHLARFHADHPRRSAIAVVGCGNLGLNRGVRAWRGGGWLGVEGPEGGAIAVDAVGRGRRVAVNDEPGDGWVITGPDLVREGRPAISDVTTFADPRHLLLFPYVKTDAGERVDFGHDLLIADPALCRSAVAHQPVRLPITDVTHQELLDALAVKGYAASARPNRVGTYHIDGDVLELVFFPGLYPHHALAVGAGGVVTSWVVPGLSNRAGTSIEALAAWLVTHGARDAILLDNGGDVGLWLNDSKQWSVRPAEPDREDAWPLTACLIYSTITPPGDD